MLEFRVTKYNPAYRNSSGVHLRNEWTSISDIGREFEGVVLTEPMYQNVEDSYATAAIAFLKEAGISSLVVNGLENHRTLPLPFSDGISLELVQVDKAIRGILREQFWCRLDGPDAFVHVGHDYCMYVGVPRLCPTAESYAQQRGLFIEPFRSPHRDQNRV